MASVSHAYTETFKDNSLAAPRARFGGPRRRRPTLTRHERNELFGYQYGSHMPLDTDIHWQWSNPLNLLPAAILFFLAFAIVALVLA